MRDLFVAYPRTRTVGVKGSQELYNVFLINRGGTCTEIGLNKFDLKSKGGWLTEERANERCSCQRGESRNICLEVSKYR